MNKIDEKDWLCLGINDSSDEKGFMYIKIPPLFIDYKESFEDALKSIFDNLLVGKEYNIIIKKLIALELLYKFKNKHTKAFFNTTNERELEYILKEEFKEFSNNANEEDYNKEAIKYKKLNKNLLTSYLIKYYKQRLKEFDERLNNIEL